MGENYPSLDTETVLWELRAGFESICLIRRLEVLKAFFDFIGRPVSSEIEPLSKPQTRYLARLLLSTLYSPQFLERSWIKGLYNAVGHAAKSMRCPMFTMICGTSLAGKMVFNHPNQQATQTLCISLAKLSEYEYVVVNCQKVRRFPFNVMARCITKIKQQNQPITSMGAPLQISFLQHFHSKMPLETPP